MDQAFRSEQLDTLLYLDAGVHGVSLDRWDKPKPETGNGGQIAVGLKVNGTVCLESVGTLYPEVLTDTESRIPGCGEVIQSAPQRSATNKMAAQLANNILNTLLTEKAILIHQILFDSRLCGSRPVFVEAQREGKKSTSSVTTSVSIRQPKVQEAVEDESGYENDDDVEDWDDEDEDPDVVDE